VEQASGPVDGTPGTVDLESGPVDLAPGVVERLAQEDGRLVRDASGGAATLAKAQRPAAM